MAAGSAELGGWGGLWFGVEVRGWGVSIGVLVGRLEEGICGSVCLIVHIVV
jgi:hypothetical protein